MILEDCIMLARTVPEPSKKYGVKVCSVMYSPELRRLIRVYPLLPKEKMKRRSTFRMELERNIYDSRDESFKKVNYENTGHECSMLEVKDILSNIASDDICILNERKKSLGVIIAESEKYFAEMRSRKEAQDINQLCLFENERKDFNGIKTGKDYDHLPYIIIPSMRKQKALQIREWQLFMLLNKNEGIISTPYLQELFKDKDTYLIIGNLNGCRSIWIICSYFNYSLTTQQRLF